MKNFMFFLVFTALLANLCFAEYSFFEDFTATGFPYSGWIRINVQGSNQWHRYTGLNHSSPACVEIEYEDPVGEDWLITPQIPIGSADTLSFWARKYYSAIYEPDSLWVKISTTTNDITSFTNTIGSHNVNFFGTANWTHLMYDLSAYSGQSIYIGFHHYDEDGNGCMIDDVGIITKNPVISEITDVPADQGRQVQVIWLSSEFENTYSPNLFYSLWRLDEIFMRNSQPYIITSIAHLSDAVNSSAGKPIYWQNDDEIWTFIDQIPALQYPQYAYISPTIMDSCSNDTNYSTFKIIYHGTTDFYESIPDSGYSVDNIPPNAVDNINIVKNAGNVEIQWSEVTEGTYHGNSYPEVNGIWYKIYGSIEPYFICDPSTYIDNTENLNYIYNLTGEQRKFFKVIAVDQQP